MNLAQQLNKLSEPKKTYLEILKVHDKEVPIANLLAFFFKNDKLHGLKDLFIRALLKTKYYELDIKESPTSIGTLISQIESPNEQKKILNSIREIKVKTEEPTNKDNQDSNKRIDILIETKDFVICIEFKINHDLNNPLKTYENHIRKSFKNSDKRFFFIVLTPVKKEANVSNVKSYLEKNKVFKQVIFSHFIKKVKEELPADFENSVNANYLNDLIQTISNREVRHKRSLLLNTIDAHLNNRGLSSNFHKNNKGGYLQIDTLRFNVKIRIENKKFQIEKWEESKAKKIIQTFDLETDLIIISAEIEKTCGNTSNRCATH